MKYFRHFPLAFWAVVCLLLGGVMAFAQYRVEPIQPTRPAAVQPADERANAMSLITHLSTVHAAAAPPATALSVWATETASLAQALADRRAAITDDLIASAYRDVAASALGLATVDPSNREQILTGILNLGASGTRLGATVSGLPILSPANKLVDSSVLAPQISSGIPVTQLEYSNTNPTERG
jgi:hypothetical protein